MSKKCVKSEYAQWSREHKKLVRRLVSPKASAKDWNEFYCHSKASHSQHARIQKMIIGKEQVAVLWAAWCIAASAQFIDPNLPSFDEAATMLGMPSSAEISAQVARGWDTDQIPAGWRGLQPSGRLPDGRLIFDGMPSYADVPGAFVARVSKPAPIMPQYGIPLPSETIILEVPAKGHRRNAWRRKHEKVWRKWMVEAERRSVEAGARYYTSGDAYADSVESEKREAEWRRKDQVVRDAEHQRQLDLKDRLFYHMNDNQLKHYRDGWKPVVQPIGGLQHGTPNYMVGPDGNVYYVP